MKRTWKRITLAAMISLLSVGCIGMVMHHLIPHGHKPAVEEFGLGPRRSASGQYSGTLATDQPLKVRSMQSIRFAIADSAGRAVDGVAITVDGGMPQHGHGLPTQPRVTQALGQGVYVVEGLKFNMGGWWELKFRIDGAAGRDSITFNLDL